MTTTIDLSGEGWRLRGALPSAWELDDLEEIPGGGGTGWIPAGVPGSVQQDLWSAGLLDDPYAGRNSLGAEWATQRVWVYERTFAGSPGWRGGSVRLRLEGIDYRARVLLNGTLLGEHESMFTPALFDVADVVRCEGENRLTVVLAPAPAEQDQLGRTSLVRTRKTRMGYWWDFAPRLVSLGLWDSVRLEVSGTARIEDVAVHPVLADDHGNCALTIEVTVAALAAGDHRATVDILRDDVVVASAQQALRLHAGESTTAAVDLEIARPDLWWPNGMGEQAMYRAVVQLDSGGGGSEAVDERTADFGIRSITLAANETLDPTAPPYTFVLNGRRVYINGWNWVPIDSLYGPSRPEKLAHLLELAARAHCNLLRVNGVGVIEREDFYAHCDRLGILVWQEFVVTSSATDRKPSEDPEYLNAVVAEATAIVPRRRNHPSLAIWCAGNELESLDKLPLDDSEPLIGALKLVAERLDPDTVWLPTSARGRKPFNGLSSIRRDPDGLHDVHGPWLYEGLTEQYELYNAGTSLFHSELGAEGITNPETLRAVLPWEELSLERMDSPTWRHLSAWWVRPEVWASWFGDVSDFDRLVALTQWLQAEGVRYGVESNRRRAFRNSGSLPWQFNEPYPMVGSTAAVDYYGRPKPLYYAVASAYRPLALSARYDTLAWGGRDEFVAELWVASALPEPVPGASVVARVRGATGEILVEQRLSVDVAADGPTRLGSIVCPVDRLGGGMFFLDLELEDAGSGVRAAQRLCFSAALDLAPLAQLAETSLSVDATAGSVAIANTGGTAAVGVRIADAADVRLLPALLVDDSAFTLFPGETRTVALTWTDPARSAAGVSVTALNAPEVLAVPER
ncbi:hypothetical protein GCM10025866_02600 [Naasia aerilata]|uniref:beta-mannosidase n=2 Tax=Naasia aerilata TaxID=1162966 RepID=A0ABM8G8B7_9MICO|nr:hypothetical protein GCM10025866_02600 [Naasia aerilata]